MSRLRCITKGITIVPGGFLAGESIWRQRALSADIYTNFNATSLHEFGARAYQRVGSQCSSIAIVHAVNGKVYFGNLNGFFECDFFSAGTTSNNLQSNSYTLRVRQAWGQAAFSHMKFAGGQNSIRPKKHDLFGYAGTEYVQRTVYLSSTGTLVGYAPPTAIILAAILKAFLQQTLGLLRVRVFAWTQHGPSCRDPSAGSIEFTPGPQVSFSMVRLTAI
jgi:hypothetical protein